MVAYEKIILVVLWTEHSNSTLKKEFLKNTMIKLFTDQSEVSAFPAGC